jgi:hypothetical protein
VWHDSWGPRYGVLSGYGIYMQNGFQDTFTGTAMGALEMGAMPYGALISDQICVCEGCYCILVHACLQSIQQRLTEFTVSVRGMLLDSCPRLLA